MKQFTTEELKEQNLKAAKTISLMIALAFALVVWGFLESSLPAYLLAAFFFVISVAESKEYRKSYQVELNTSKLNNN